MSFHFEIVSKNRHGLDAIRFTYTGGRLFHREDAKGIFNEEILKGRKSERKYRENIISHSLSYFLSFQAFIVNSPFALKRASVMIYEPYSVWMNKIDCARHDLERRYLIGRPLSPAI